MNRLSSHINMDSSSKNNNYNKKSIFSIKKEQTNAHTFVLTTFCWIEIAGNKLRMENCHKYIEHHHSIHVVPFKPISLLFLGEFHNSCTKLHHAYKSSTCLMLMYSMINKRDSNMCLCVRSFFVNNLFICTIKMVFFCLFTNFLLLVLMMIVLVKHGESVSSVCSGHGGRIGDGNIISIGIAIFKWKCTPYSLLLRTFSHVGLSNTVCECVFVCVITFWFQTVEKQKKITKFFEF